MSLDAPSNAAALEAALSAAGTVAPGSDAFAVDGLKARYVVTPADVGGFADSLAAANNADASVVPRGGGRQMALGNVPRRYDVALRTAALNSVLEYEPADMTATVEAGISMGDLASALAEHGQFLPFDAPSDASLGGVLAAAVSGPSRHAYGLPRDWLLGCRIALADGTLVRAGGRVVKNVAGYDLPRLIVGSLGTLGVIVEATVKVTPLPAVEETLLALQASASAAIDAASEAGSRGLALTAVAVLDGGAASRCGAAVDESGWRAAYRVAGGVAAVARTKDELGTLAGGEDAAVLASQQATAFWSSMLEPLGDIELTITVPPAALRGLVDLLPEGRAGVVAYPTGGKLRVGLDSADAEETASSVRALREAALRAGGSLVVNAAPPGVKQAVAVWGDIAALAIMRRMKQEFDPRSTLNPGRFVGGI